MPIKQFVTAGEFPSFINGSLCPPGTIVSIDTDQIEPGPNLLDVSERPPLIPVAVASMFPTGMNPTNPQQVPPGAIQTADGYASGAHLFVGEGSSLLDTKAADGDAQKATDADWAAFQKWRAEQTKASAGPGQVVTVPDDKPDTGFNAETVIAGTIPTVVEQLDGLSPEQLEAVRAAELDREKPREGVLNAIDAKLG